MREGGAQGCGPIKGGAGGDPGDAHRGGRGAISGEKSGFRWRSGEGGVMRLPGGAGVPARGGATLRWGIGADGWARGVQRGDARAGGRAAARAGDAGLAEALGRSGLGRAWRRGALAG